jgi:hypothetical protein
VPQHTGSMNVSAYSQVLKTEAVLAAKRWLTLTRAYCVTYQDTNVFLITALKTYILAILIQFRV